MRSVYLPVLSALVLALLVGPATAAPHIPRPVDDLVGTATVDENVVHFASMHPEQLVPVLVQPTRPGAALNAVVAHGGQVSRQLSTANVVVAEVPAGAVEALSRSEGVARIAFDAPVQSTTEPAPLRESSLMNHNASAVRAAELWTAARPIQGSGVTVAVLDSGINDSREDFKSANRDLKPDNTRVLYLHGATADGMNGAKDDNGHGSAVAGVIGGRGFDSRGQYVGIAPDVRFVGVKVSNKDGVARISDVIEGIEWVVKNKSRYNIRVINLSLLSTVAESYKTSLLSAAVEMAWLKGVVVVVAAGNHGANSIRFAPANDPYVITVGATDDLATRSVADDRLATFSSYGTTTDGFAKPDLVAPGRSIVTVLGEKDGPIALKHGDKLVNGYDGTKRYVRLSGTSMAAPAVTGVVAQLLQAKPTLTPDQVKWLLQETARPIPGVGTGAGYPQAAAAVQYAGSIGEANHGLVPNIHLAKAACTTVATCGSISWGTVAWETVAWETVAWETVAWETVAWETVAWETVAWETVAWEALLP